MKKREKTLRFFLLFFFIMAHGKINKIIICKFIIHIENGEKTKEERWKERHG